MGSEGVALGSTKEAGLIVVRHLFDTLPRDPQAASEAVRRALGGELPPSATLETGSPAKVKGGYLLPMQISAVAADGVPVKGRVVVVSANSGTLIVFGLTTVPKFPQLARRVDQIARSAHLPKAGGNPAVARMLAGEWKTGGGSTNFGVTVVRESDLALCPDGRFFSSESSGVSSSQGYDTTGDGYADSYVDATGASQHSTVARWEAVGTPQAGRIVVRRGGQVVETIAYRIQGSDVYFDGAIHWREDLGYCQ
ncbi:MAG: hypothetical protein D6729_03210 [Deltaproteobacteria bacterium]|nr:MAG: hypothetical protein D6729_03210 [Deltaproteobacteria bacterium]